MTHASNTQRPTHEAGFTLVELVVAMAISLLVLFAILTTLDTFSRNAARQTRVTDANDQVRGVVDRVVADLRQAATIEVARRNNLVYTVADSATQTRRERICRDSSDRLWRYSATYSVPPAPIPAGAACPGSASATMITQLASANSNSNPMFRYDDSTPASVRSVGITIALDAGNAGHADVSTLRASAFMRSRGEGAPAVDDDDLTVACNTAGQPTLTLSSSVGHALDVQYTDVAGTSLGTAEPGSHLTLNGVSGTIIANVTSSAGLVSQLVKVISC